VIAMVSMQGNDLGPDEAASFAEFGGLLQRVASRGPFGTFAADVVARRYRDALGYDRDEELRVDRWRDFIVALNAFLVLHASDHRDDMRTLHSIVLENADLLPYRDDAVPQAFAVAV
jgi:hypothetical protein